MFFLLSTLLTFGSQACRQGEEKNRFTHEVLQGSLTHRFKRCLSWTRERFHLGITLALEALDLSLWKLVKRCASLILDDVKWVRIQGIHQSCSISFDGYRFLMKEVQQQVRDMFKNDFGEVQLIVLAPSNKIQVCHGFGENPCTGLGCKKVQIFKTLKY